MIRLRRGIIIGCWITCAVFAVTGHVMSDDETVEAKEKISLSEDVEKALAELAAAAVKLKRELRIEEMKKIITEITEATKISDEQKIKLEDEMKPAVERSLVPWKEQFDAKLRPYLKTEGEGALAMLSQWRAEQLVPSGFPGDFGKPEDDPGWKDALKKTLTVEQYAALDNIAVERERKFNEQIADYLKPLVEQARQARAVLLANEVEDMKSLLKLPDDRVKQLQETAEASAERAGELTRKRATKALAAMKEQQRAMVINSGRSIFNNNSDETDEANVDESSQGIWVKGVASLLNEDERQRWKTAVEERSGHGARALARLFVAMMDQHVLFSSEQREKLETIAAKTLTEWSKKRSKNEDVSPMQAKLFNADEVKTVLDSGQWERWEAAGRGEYYGRNGNRRRMRRASEEENEEPATQKVKLEIPDDETLFASYFEKCLAGIRREMAGAMSAKLDDVRRFVKLPPDRATYLEIAAKGAVEHALDTQREQLESWARNQVQGAKGEALRKRLAEMNTEDFGFGDDGTTDDRSLWKDALTETLTAEQRNVWSEALAARETYRKHAYACGILAEFNRRYHLSNDQLGKLEPLVETAVVEYFDDFMNMFGRGSSQVNARYLITLFMAVPEESAQSILNSRQWKQWKDVDSKMVAPWWESMKNNHSRKNTRQ